MAKKLVDISDDVIAEVAMVRRTEGYTKEYAHIQATLDTLTQAIVSVLDGELPDISLAIRDGTITLKIHYEHGKWEIESYSSWLEAS